MPIHNTDVQTDINTDMTTPSADYAPSEHPIPAHPDPARALPSPQRLPSAVIVTLIVIALLLLAGIVYRFIGGAADERHLAKQTKLDAIPTVDVISPIVSGATSEIALPGNANPVTE